MALILSIETSSENCSVAISDNGKIISSSQSTELQSHASVLTVLIEEIMTKNSLKIKQLDAVAVSKGPGSYTGLRIGVSVAKGLCFGSGKPLIAINTLKSMMSGLKIELNDFSSRFTDETVFCPMLDARRMEVYMALFSKNGDEISETAAVIIDEVSFGEILENKSVVFFGSGSDKCQEIIKSKNAVFIRNFTLKADYVSILAEEAYISKTFADVAYFEPFYLKDFIATTPKRKII